MQYEKFCNESFDAKFYKPEYFKKMYPDEETYKKRQTAFSAYAAVPYGKPWTATGEMGWFGFSSDEPEDKINWDLSFFERFIK